MSNVFIDYSKNVGKIKIMHAVNNGPSVSRGDQTRGNQNAYKAAKIPYARTHDAAFYNNYGGEHTIDVEAIFRNFDADVNDPNSYDFACTDRYISEIFEFGTKPFYRLGSRIEHEVKKYHTLPPKDFQKYAEICEHIIRHFTEGWDNGFRYDLEYWEIWNEPDLDPDDSTNKKCWGGTAVQFAEFYTVVSTHLKKCFPHLKIGGPSLAWSRDWLKKFFEDTYKFNNNKRIPLDFISYHWYGCKPRELAEKGTEIVSVVKEAGYTNFESILNEWNYVKGWTDEFIYTIKSIISMKGAAFTAACMLAAQNNPDIDMLMYYDARPCGFNGLFDMYTLEPLKGYYPFVMFSRLYDIKEQNEATSDDLDVYVASACNGEKCATMISWFTDDDNEVKKTVKIKFNGRDMSGAKISLLDENHTMNDYYDSEIKDNEITISLKRNSVILIEN